MLCTGYGIVGFVLTLLHVVTNAIAQNCFVAVYCYNGTFGRWMMYSRGDVCLCDLCTRVGVCMVLCFFACSTGLPTHMRRTFSSTFNLIHLLNFYELCRTHNELLPAVNVYER